MTAPLSAEAAATMLGHSVILNAAEIAQITGYQQAKRQHAWLTAHGFKATINARNECIVFRADLETRVPERPRLRLLHSA